MKVTTVRFGEDLWGLLESEAERTGVSVSQYIREAALARAAFAVGARAGAPEELLGAWTRAFVRDQRDSLDLDVATQRLIAVLTRARARQQREDAAALVGESRQALHQAKTIGRQRPERPND